MLNEDYKEILQSLLKHKVRFLVVGAYAMGAHGFPRATGDFDICVEATTDNSKKIHRALLDFGAPIESVSKDTAIAKYNTSCPISSSNFLCSVNML